MCVSIPGQITNIIDSAHRIALVDILGQPRTINRGLLSADEGAVGDWVLLAVGDVLAGCILVKAITMGIGLISATWFSVSAGLPLEIGLTIVYSVIVIGGLGMAVWVFRHCRG